MRKPYPISKAEALGRADYVAQRIRVETETGCWEWTGTVDNGGYGYAFMSRSPLLRVHAHRLVWVLYRDVIPEGLTIDHLCRNRICVNPDHLEPVTVHENTMRGIGPTARQAKQTHCKRGHEFTKENIYRGSGGRRVCRICRDQRDRTEQYRKDRERYAARKANA